VKWGRKASGHGAEVDQRLELRSAKLQDLLKGDPGDFQLAGLKRGLADEGPQLVAVGRQPGEVREKLANGAGAGSDESELQRAELAPKLLCRMSRVCRLGEDAIAVRFEPPGKVTRQELLVGDPFPAVHNLGAGDNPLGFEQPAEGLDTGVGDGQVVLDLGKVLGGGGYCP